MQVGEKDSFFDQGGGAHSLSPPPNHTPLFGTPLSVTAAVATNSVYRRLIQPSTSLPPHQPSPSLCRYGLIDSNDCSIPIEDVPSSAASVICGCNADELCQVRTHTRTYVHIRSSQFPCPSAPPLSPSPRSALARTLFCSHLPMACPPP